LGYLCRLSENADGCHQTTTRVAPIFLTGNNHAKTSIDSLPAIYEDLCGAAYADNNAHCKPTANKVYQMSYDDGDGGHSFFLACMKAEVAHDGGCVVLQGYAGMYRLKDWIDGNINKVIKANKGNGVIPTAGETYGVPHFGGLKVIHGAELHRYFKLLKGYSSATPHAVDLLPFWNCEMAPASCQRLLSGTHVLVAENSEHWAQAVDHKNKANPIKAYAYAWSGACDTLANTRAHGAVYQSRFCGDHPEKYKSACTMGLGLIPNALAQKKATKPGDVTDEDRLVVGTPGSVPGGAQGEDTECLRRAVDGDYCTAPGNCVYVQPEVAVVPAAVVPNGLPVEEQVDLLEMKQKSKSIAGLKKQRTLQATTA
jgi:hypothetical protein